MANNVYKFRRVKWGNPREKLKVLAEDFQRKVWLIVCHLSNLAF